MSNTRRLVDNDLGSLVVKELADALAGIKTGKTSLMVGIPAVSSVSASYTLAATDHFAECPIMTVTDKDGIYLEDVTLTVDTTVSAHATAYDRIYIGYRLSGDASTTWIAKGSTFDYSTATGHGFGTITAFTPVSFARDIVTGYPLASTVTITDGGTGATTGTIAVTNGGGINAAGEFYAAAGIVTQAWITDSGHGFTSADSVTLTPSSGTAVLAATLATNPNEQKLQMQYLPQGATLICKVVAASSLDAAAVTITNGGTGFTAGDVLFDGGDGADAVGTYTVGVGAGDIDSVTISTVGHGFTEAPTLTFSDPSAGGSGETITVALDTATGVALSNCCLTAHYRTKGDEVALKRSYAVGRAFSKALLSDVAD